MGRSLDGGRLGKDPFGAGGWVQSEAPTWSSQAPCCHIRLSSWCAAMMWRKCCPQHLPAVSSQPWGGSGSQRNYSWSTSPLPWTVGAESPFLLRAARKGRYAAQEGFLEEGATCLLSRWWA